MTLFVEIVYVLITIILILVVLLQAGRGGGMGTALGGGASQSVFGGGGGADFLAKLTQGLAAGFMICAVYLAYASAHSGSDRLQESSQESELEKQLVDEDEAIDYERIGTRPVKLPEASAQPLGPGGEPLGTAAAPTLAPADANPAGTAPAVEPTEEAPAEVAEEDADGEPAARTGDEAAEAAEEPVGEADEPAAPDAEEPAEDADAAE